MENFSGFDIIFFWQCVEVASRDQTQCLWDYEHVYDWRSSKLVHAKQTPSQGVIYQFAGWGSLLKARALIRAPVRHSPVIKETNVTVRWSPRHGEWSAGSLLSGGVPKPCTYHATIETMLRQCRNAKTISKPCRDNLEHCEPFLKCQIDVEM